MNTQSESSGNAAPSSLARLYGAFVRHPRLSAVIAAIDECIEVSHEDQEPRCMMIMGESGVGKSTLISQVLKNYPPRDTPGGRVVPVLAIDVPAPTSVKGVVTTLLQQLRDPQPDRGSTVVQTERLYKLLRGCRVEMIILDEFQHLLDGKTTVVIAEVSDFVKTLINRAAIPFVLVGMPTLRLILEGPQQVQLRGRFMHQMTLEPFGWLKDDGVEYRTFLKHIESTLPFDQPSNLFDHYRAMRLYVASRGYLRPTMRVIKSAARYAIKSKEVCIGDEALGRAFDIEIGAGGFVSFNPFRAASEQVEAEVSGKAKGSGGRSSNRIKSKSKTDQPPSMTA